MLKINKKKSRNRLKLKEKKPISIELSYFWCNDWLRKQYLRDKAVLKDNDVIHMRQKADAMRH